MNLSVGLASLLLAAPCVALVAVLWWPLSVAIAAVVAVAFVAERCRR